MADVAPEVTLGDLMTRLTVAANTPTTCQKNRELLRMARNAIGELGTLVDALETKVDMLSAPVVTLTDEPVAPARLGCVSCGGAHSDGSVCTPLEPDEQHLWGV
jgi:hypothetical protein